MGTRFGGLIPGGLRCGERAGKQTLVGVKFDLVETPEDFPFQPAEGAPLFPVVDGVRGEEAVGAGALAG